jgi:hypothetical protein
MTKLRTLLLAGGCTAAGALGAGAIGTSAHGTRHHGGEHFGLLRAVHADVVVPRSDDTFATVTFDRGAVESVSGRDLTIREGTKDATYKTVTLTIPDDAKIVIRNVGDRHRFRHRHFGGGDSAQLSDLKAGDKVAVWQSSRKTVVLAAVRRDSDKH